MLLLAGCVEGGDPGRTHRWPDHRKNHDQQLEDLQKRVDLLEKELAETRAYIARLHVKELSSTASPGPSGHLHTRAR